MFACHQTRTLVILSTLSALLLTACELAPEGDEWTEGPEAQDELTGLRAAAPLSEGYYSFPYEAGVRVKVSRDHLTHTPENRIDMSGVSGGPYRVVAAARGTVRFIEDSHNVTGGCENNNYVWIEHANGEWTKYSHISKNSARVDAGLSVGEAIKAGQFLGIEDDIGCASGNHVHFEVAIPDDPSDPINPVGGYIKGDNLVPRVCGISGNKFVAGTTYTVPEIRPGYGEYARHGLADDQFQAVFDAASNCGYRLDWNDGFDRNGTATFNPVFHPNKSPALQWKSHRKLTKAELDDKKAEYSSDGYELVHIDVYNVGSAVRYAAIFQKGTGVANSATYAGLSAADHQTTLDNWEAAGWRPRVISAASVNGVRTYAGVYTKGSIGSWQAKSFQTAAEYQDNYTANKEAGRRLIYLNSYVHDGAPRYTAIWASSAPANVFAKHGQSSAQYQTLWQTQIGAGWRTGAVSGVHVGGTTLYAAFWEK